MAFAQACDVKQVSSSVTAETIDVGSLSLAGGQPASPHTIVSQSYQFSSSSVPGTIPIAVDDAADTVAVVLPDADGNAGETDVYLGGPNDWARAAARIHPRHGRPRSYALVHLGSGRSHQWRWRYRVYADTRHAVRHLRLSRGLPLGVGVVVYSCGSSTRPAAVGGSPSP